MSTQVTSLLPRVQHRRRTDQARALAVVLGDEFATRFVFHEPETGAVLEHDRETGGRAPQALDATLLAELLRDGRARALRLPEGGFRLLLPLWDSCRPVLIAEGRLPALAGGDQEQSRLQKWLQAVGDRLRLTEQMSSRRRGEQDQSAQVTTAWEALLTLDDLIRRMRIQRDPAKNRRRILEAARDLLNVEAIAWVPLPPDAPVVIQEGSCLAPSDCRPLIDLLAKDASFTSADPYLCNDLHQAGGAGRFEQIANAVVFTVADNGTVGWVVAVNKRERRKLGADDHVAPSRLAFRRGDAALLTPFVGLLQLHVRASERYQNLKELLVGLTRSLTAALDAKDSYTYGHSERVARIAVELGKELGMQPDELSDIYLAGLLHDVGKIGVRDAVLSKAGPLTPEEFDHIKQHVTTGYAILSDLRPIRNLLPGVLYHHERYDGGGYPDGLAGDEIPVLARILAVADAYDAMSTTRPYRDAMPCRKVEQILLEGGGKQWDQRIIDAFVRCRQKIHTIRQRGVGDSLQAALEGALRVDQSSTAVAGRPRPLVRSVEPRLPTSQPLTCE